MVIRAFAPTNRRSVFKGLAIGLVLAIGGAALDHSAALLSYERAANDAWHRLAGVRHIPRQVAIVGIDEAALAARPDEPLVFWTPHFARALQVLHQMGATVVGVDLLLTVSPEAWLGRSGLPTESMRAFDQPFRQALGQGRTVLTAFATGTGGELVLPNRDYWLSLPNLFTDVALANLDYDSDGVLRNHKIVNGNRDSPRHYLGPLLAARKAGQDLQAGHWTLPGQGTLAGQPIDTAQFHRQLPFSGPPGTVPVTPIGLLLADGAQTNPAVQALKGKVVILAATYHAAQDVHPTPYAPQMMHGAEVHAQIAEALLSGRHIQRAPVWLHWLALVLAAAAATLLVAGRPGVVRGGLLAVGGALAGYALAYTVWWADVALPVAGLQAILLGGYVLGLGLGLRGSERRRAELRTLFGRYVSDEVVTHLLASENEPELGGKARQVTVLFSDIRNFTTMSEQMTAQEVVEMLNAWFTLVAKPILANGGTIDKYIGDAIMAVFGAPVEHPDHARRALRAAATMAEQAVAFRGWMEKRFPQRQLPTFAIGVGVHSGEAVSGTIGSPQRLEYTTIGDTVNAASRLEGLTKTLGATVVISQATADAAGPGLKVGEPQTAQVKGRQGAMAILVFHGMDDDSTGAA